jgi:CHAT domain-containing protein/lipopolysaccharide biosynthesis regulator YciM
MKYLFSVIVLLCLSSIPTFSADDWEKSFQKIEDYYFKGDYKRALKENKALCGSIEKKAGKENVTIARAYFQQAKIEEALSKFDDYKSILEHGFSVLNISEKPSTPEYARGMAYAAAALMEYGDFARAEECINIATKIIKSTATEDLQLVNDIKFKALQIMYHQGFLNKAEKLIPELINFRKSRIVKEEIVVNPKTGLSKAKKLPANELRNRNRELSNVLNLYAKIEIAQSNKFKADSILTRNAYLIRREIRKKDVSYVNNLFTWAKLFESIGDNKNAVLKYADAFKFVTKTKKIKYNHTAKPVLELYGSYAQSLLVTGNTTKYKRKIKSLEVKVKRYYGQNSIYYADILLLQAKRPLLKEDFDKTIPKLEFILSNPLILPDEHIKRSPILKLLADNYLQNSDYEKTEGLLTKRSELEKHFTGKDAPYYHEAMLDLANFHVYYSNKFKIAEEIYDKSLPVLKKELDPRQDDYINYMLGLSKLYELTDKFEQAFKIINNIVDVQKKKYVIDDVHYAVALEKLASINISTGNYIEAEKNLNEAMRVFKKGNNDENISYTNTLETLSRLYIIQGNYEEAEKNLKKSRRLSKRSEKESLKMGGTMEELATLYIYLGKYQETEVFLNESIKKKEAKLGTSHRNLINPYHQMGLLYLITGNYTEAEKFAKKATDISLKIFGDSSVKYAENLDLLARIYSAIGDYEKAEEPATKVVEIERSHYGPNHIQLARSLQELAIVKYHNKGKTTQVEKLLQDALKIIKDNLGEENPEYAEALKNLALFYLDSDKVGEAETMLGKADNIWTKKFGPDNIHSAEISFIRGNISYQKKKYEEARNFFTVAKNIYSKNFDDKHPDYVKALSREAQMYFILGDYKTARKDMDEATAVYLNFIKNYFPSLSEREKGKFWSLIKNEFEFYNSLAVQMKDPELIGNIYNFTLNIKAILLNTSIKVKERILSSNDTTLVNKYASWTAKKELLTMVLSMTAEQKKTSGFDIAIMEKEIESLEKELSEKSELFAKNYEKSQYTWEKIKNVLAPNEYAVEIIRFRKFNTAFSDTVYYAALVVSAETKKYPDMVLLKNGKELESKYLKYYRNCIKHKVEDGYSYDQFWKPLKTLIKDNSTVFLSCDGVYNQMNLEAIPTPQGNFIINSNDVVLVSNTRDIINRNKKKPGTNKQVELFGNPLYYTQSSADTIATDVIHNIKQLPGAEAEIVELQKLLKSSGWLPETFMEKTATEEQVKNLNNPKVFHIATHGFFMEDANVEEDKGTEGVIESKAIQNPLLRSGLLLRNGGERIAGNNVYDFNKEEGILTAYEAMNLNLDNTELVVLSACETARGEVQLGEGVYGLQRAFLVAGANSVVMSLFKVNDQVTKELMVSFYKKWIATGNKRKSFSDAKKEIKEKYNAPVYWGSFVMIGMD